MRPFWRIKDVCRLFECSENWVYLHHKELGSAKIAGKLFFDPRRVRAWMENRFEANRQADVIAGRVV